MADREKSALYPGATWNECIDLIQKINSFSLKSVSYQELAKKYGDDDAPAFINGVLDKIAKC